MVVSDLFELNKDYNQITYLAGADGGGRQICDIDILELPDGMYWVKEGDFIVTMGYFFTTSNVSFENFIRLLIFNKAAGLGVKLGRFFDKIPAAALQMADENHFPIINYPLHMGYKSITRPVMNWLMEQERYTQYTLGTYKAELSKILEEGCEIGKIAEHLKRYIHRDLFLLWGNHRGFIYRTSERGGKEVRHFLDNQESGEFLVYPVNAKGQTLAYLCLSNEGKDALTDTDRLLVEETFPHILIYLLLETRLGQYENRSKEQFFAEILDGKYEKNREKMIGEAKRLGVDLEKRWQMVGINSKMLSDAERERLCRKAEFHMDAYKFQYVLLEKAKCVCLWVELEENRGGSSTLNQRLTRMAKDIEDSFRSFCLPLYVSKKYGDLQELSAAWEELLYMFSREEREDGAVYFYDDFQMEHLLLGMKEQAVMKKICRDLDEKIRDFENRGQTDILDTLKELVANDFNLTKAAETMYLHRNTLYKRIRKIERLLGMDLDNGETKLMLQLFMRAREGK